MFPGLTLRLSNENTDDLPLRRQLLQHEGGQKRHQVRLLGEHPLERVLRLILQQVSLTYSVRNGRVIISNQEVEPEDLILRVYDVSDLVFPVNDFPAPD